MQALSGTGSVIKLRQWWDSKIPPLLAFAYMLILKYPAGFISASIELSLLMIWIIGAAGFGHYLNDCFDVNQDAAAGKKNVASSHSRSKQAMILFTLFVVLLLPWVINGRHPIILLLVLLQLVLFLLYSAPPFRLKEKGLAGIFSDAMYAHTIPTFVVIFAFMKNELQNFSGEEWSFLITCFLWTLTWGLRNIIAHQIADSQSDQKSGTVTFVVRKGKPRSIFLVTSILVPLEILTFFVWIRLLLPVVVPVFLLFVVYKLLLYKLVWKLPLSADIPGSLNSFLSNFYEQWFPVIPLIALSINNPLFVILLILHLFLFPQFLLNLRNQLKSIFKVTQK